MKNLNEKFRSIWIIDNTFGANRFPMPLIVGWIVNSGTLIVSFALLSQETAEEYQWYLRSFIECFNNKSLTNIIIDEGPSIKKVVEIQ